MQTEVSVASSVPTDNRGHALLTPLPEISQEWREAGGAGDTVQVGTTSLLQSILNWLRAGYPDGVPGPDRVPLLALLRATPLTEEQLREVISRITARDSAAVTDGAIDADEIGAFVEDVTHHDAGPENIARVAATLAAAGWPLAGVDTPGPAPTDDAGRPASAQ